MSNETKNTAAIAEFEGKNNVARPVGAEMAASREAQEVQVAMIAAKKFPRDEVAAYNRILQDCQRTSLAEKAMYEYPREDRSSPDHLSIWPVPWQEAGEM